MNKHGQGLDHDVDDDIAMMGLQSKKVKTDAM